MRISTKKAAAVLPTLQKKMKPRGRAFPKGHTFGFKKGQSGNPGGKPQVYKRFSAKIAEMMLAPAPPEVIKGLKLKRNATIYDAMIAAALIQCVVRTKRE